MSEADRNFVNFSTSNREISRKTIKAEKIATSQQGGKRLTLSVSQQQLQLQGNYWDPEEDSSTSDDFHERHNHSGRALSPKQSNFSFFIS